MAKKPKIAVIGLKGLPAYGGAAAVGENIIEKLKGKYNFVVYSISTHTNIKTGSYNGYRQIVFKRFPIKRLNVLYYYLMSLFHVIQGDYDIIHLHHRTAAFILIFLKWRYKTITTLHSVTTIQKFKYFKKYFDLQDYILYKFSDVIVNVSKYNTPLIEKIAKKKLSYIPNGININNSNNYTKPVTGEYILFAANRIIYEKGCHLFIEALKNIDYKGKVIIIGDMSHQKKYIQGLKETSKGLNILFQGLIKDKKLLFSYIKNAKYFVFPSLVEAMSMMLLEVVSLKTPVICSNIFANKSIFNDNEVLFFESENTNDLKNKLIYAENNITRLEKNAEQSFNKVCNFYTWDKISKEYDKIFMNLLHG